MYENEIKQFLSEGYCVIPGMLSEEECDILDTEIEKIFEKEPDDSSHRELNCQFTLVRLFELHDCFLKMNEKKEISYIAKTILGNDYHLIADGVIYNHPGQSISRWHVDDGVWLPLNDEIEQYSKKIIMPVLSMTFMVMLSDVNVLEDGPTEIVPYSHYSGREPNSQEGPNFYGNTPVSIYGKKGSVYIINGQAWHRGAPNKSEKIRKVFQLCYSPRWVSQRFYPFVNYQLPKKIMETASSELLRILGVHKRGAFG